LLSVSLFFRARSAQRKKSKDTTVDDVIIDEKDSTLRVF
jgi:hypothetical protein